MPAFLLLIILAVFGVGAGAGCHDDPPVTYPTVAKLDESKLTLGPGDKVSLTVYYGAMRYGGVSFALLEDRKFKTGDADMKDPTGAPYPLTGLELLGARQEAFLGAWRTMHPGLPKVALAQTQGHRGQAATLLGVGRNTVTRKLASRRGP